MSSLAAFQQSFHEAMVADIATPPYAAYPAFAVYRNTALRAAIDALEANFPAVACLVGRDWFRAAAAAYADACPPQDARLLFYGEHFAAFLGDSPVAQTLPYLADVARLDRLWTESQNAADARALGPDEVTPDTHVMPHPAVRTLLSEVPVVDIWRPSRAGVSVDAALRWEPQAALVTRPLQSVIVTTMEPGDLALLTACAGGATATACIHAVAHAVPSARAHLTLARLLTAGALIRP